MKYNEVIESLSRKKSDGRQMIGHVVFAVKTVWVGFKKEGGDQMTLEASRSFRHLLQGNNYLELQFVSSPLQLTEI
jgi:hypothetical protein